MSAKMCLGDLFCSLIVESERSFGSMVPSLAAGEPPRESIFLGPSWRLHAGSGAAIPVW